MPIEKKFSTETAILDICDNIWTNMENIKLTSIIYDRYDTVNHSNLLEVMESYFGIKSIALNGISSYLN